MKYYNLSIVYTIAIYLFFAGLKIQAQCDLLRYNELIKEGDSYLNKSDPDYEKAMNAYSAAMITCKENMPEVQEKIITLFDNINELKTKAESAEKYANKEKQNALKEKTRADSLLRIANKILKQLYFYDDKIALAVKKDINTNQNQYGYINKQGNTVIKFKYEEAYPFDENTGFAIVKKDDYYYLIDTTGNREYPYCNDIDMLNNNIEALDLHNKQLEGIPEQVFKSQIMFLLLAENKIEQIPDSISFYLDSLCYLDLSRNKIRSIPDEIGNFKNLSRLILKSNSLISVPNEIGNLTILTTLDLNRNNLNEIPPAIGKLKNLTKLDLGDNNLTLLPSEIGSLKNLNVLNISKNHLISLPPEIQNFSSLLELNLSNNDLVAVPMEIWNLKNLSILKLNNNNLTLLAPEFGNLLNLKELDLTNNQLTNIPKEIGNLKKLTILDLSNNDITHLPNEIRNLTNLTRLYLYDSKISNSEKEQIQMLIPNCEILW
jgi:Leucine-rich repeat (LRR) protein